MIRKATLEDSPYVFVWRNNKETRANSITTKPVDWYDHIGWYAKKVFDKNTLMMIIEDETPQGMIRYDIDGIVAHVSINIASEARGKGIGSVLVEESMKFLPATIKNIFAEIKADNVSSQKLFSKFNNIKIEII